MDNKQNEKVINGSGFDSIESKKVENTVDTEPEQTKIEVEPSEEGVDFEPGTCVRSGGELLKESETALLASLAEEVREKRAEVGKAKEKKRVLKGVAWALALALLAACAAFMVTTGFLDCVGANHPLAAKSEVELEIAKGSSLGEVADALGEVGAVRYPLLFRLYVKLKGDFSQFKYGIYTVSGDMSYSDIIDLLETAGKSADTVRAMIPEGSTVDSIAALLEKNGVCKASDFKRVAKQGDFSYDFLDAVPDTVYYRLEGYLFPDTYDFYTFGGEEGARRAASRMLENFKSKLVDEYTEAAAERGYSLHEMLTMASVVELEAGNAAYTDKEKVSAVFYNRLAWMVEPNRLGSSPTASYPYGDGAYDTNKNEGLPPGPLCSPGLSSVKAAAFPAEGFEMCYFVTDKNNLFYYNRTYAEHLSTISELRQRGLWK